MFYRGETTKNVAKCSSCGKVNEVAYLDSYFQNTARSNYYIKLCEECAVDLGFQSDITEFLISSKICNCGNRYIKEKKFQKTCCNCYFKSKNKRRVALMLIER